MTRKKTRREKVKASKRKAYLTKMAKSQQAASQSTSFKYSLDESMLTEKVEKQETKEKVKIKTVLDSELYDYDPKLIKQDLVKTAVLSILFFAIEIGLYFYLRT